MIRNRVRKPKVTESPRKCGSKEMYELASKVLCVREVTKRRVGLVGAEG